MVLEVAKYMRYTIEYGDGSSQSVETGIYYGTSGNRSDVKLHGLKAVARFLVQEGAESDCVIMDRNFNFVCDSFGYFLNRVSDHIPGFRDALLKYLVPMQREYEDAVF